MNILKELDDYIRTETVVDINSLREKFPDRSVTSIRRDLAKLQCVTSFTNNSSYYTLSDIPSYDVYNVWSFGEIKFSKNGTAKESARILVNESSSGLSHTELQEILGIRLYGPLKDLVQEKAIRSESDGNKLMFFSGDEKIYQRQKSSRADMSSAIIGNPFNLNIVIDVLLTVFLEDQHSVEDAYRFLKSGKQPHITRKEIEEIFAYYKLPGKKN